MPIVFTIFANPHGDLLLTEEQNGIQDALNPLVSSKKIEHLIRTSANLSDFFDLVNTRPGNEFAILHFAGHAHEHILQLQDRQVSFEEMARNLFERNGKSLQLVFLNGCSTYALVDTLLTLGVPAVIATSVPVSDTKARDLAIRFYKHLALGESIQTAYQSAVRYINSSELDSTRKIEEAIQTRDFVLPSASAKEAAFPWGLYIREEYRGKELWVIRKKAYNEYLVRHLIDAIGDQCDPIRRFREKVAYRNEWETKQPIADKAKEILAYSFVGVLGLQIQKLMAIGKEGESEAKLRQYIEKCVFIADICLELLNFSFMSRLWDLQRNNPLTLPSEIANRMATTFEYNLEEQFLLMTRLFDVFKQASYSLPIPELSSIASELIPGSTLHRSVIGLKGAYEKLGTTLQDSALCYQAEEYLTQLLITFRFLTNYRMVSIKHIGYRQIRKVPPSFLHRYAALGIDSKAQENAEKIKYTDMPTHTDSVLLYRGDDYEQGINLSPFVIDYHALTFEKGTRIGFFCLDNIDQILEYRMLDDNNRLLLEERAIPQGINMNEMLLDDEKRKALNLANVVSDFREAQQLLSDGMPDFSDL